jgi:hypothetical protein
MRRREDETVLIAREVAADSLKQCRVLACERGEAPLAGLISPLRLVEFAQAAPHHDELSLLSGRILNSNRSANPISMLTSSEIVQSFSYRFPSLSAGPPGSVMSRSS